MKKKRFYDAFLDGYKPAIQFETKSRYFHRVNDLPFPRYQLDEELCMFFQTEDQKQTYLKQMKGVDENSFDGIHIMGTTLGFPQKAVEFFAKMRVLESKTGIYPSGEEKMYKIGINWAGFEFSGYLPYLEQDVGWMWKTYNHPKAIENPFYLWTKDDGYIQILYGDANQLKEVHEYIMQKRGQVPISG